MSGLKGFQRTPRAPVRERRNSSSLSSFSQFIGAGEIVQLSDLGELALRLAAAGGLENSSGSLTIKLDGSKLTLSAAGITVNEAAIDHDALLNFLANEHINHTAVAITPSAPLTGGGDITASRSIGLSLGQGLEVDASDQLRTQLRAITTKTADYTATSDDETILGDAASGAITITLPPAASSARLALNIKKIDATANPVTLDPNASETIDKSSTLDIINQYDAVTVHCDGSEWWIV